MGLGYFPTSLFEIGKIMHAAQLANAHDFIMRLTDCYNTVIAGDGGHLSGGQRQLLAIARLAVAGHLAALALSSGLAICRADYT